ncbi:MAG: hypothetical protein CMH55_08670 [Myxococcales bacterium]|nr:hypothetical protein [Myxococcales bacterium]
MFLSSLRSPAPGSALSFFALPSFVSRALCLCSVSVATVGQILDQLLLSAESTRQLVTFALILGRLLPIIVLTPFLGGKSAPIWVKMGVGVTLAILVAPVVYSQEQVPATTNAFTFLMLMMKEIFVGLCIGFILAELFFIADALGRLVDLFRQTTMATAMVPELKERSSAFGTLSYQFFIVLFLAIGGHRLFITGVFESFMTIPVTVMPAFQGNMEPFAALIMHTAARLLMVATALAMPILAATFLTDVIFGLLNRTAPQVQAYFLSLPAKAMAGVWLFAAGLGMTLDVLAREAVIYLEDLNTMLRLMR